MGNFSEGDSGEIHLSVINVVDYLNVDNSVSNLRTFSHPPMKTDPADQMVDATPPTLPVTALVHHAAAAARSARGISDRDVQTRSSASSLNHSSRDHRPATAPANVRIVDSSSAAMTARLSSCTVYPSPSLTAINSARIPFASRPAARSASRSSTIAAKG